MEDEQDASPDFGWWVRKRVRRQHKLLDWTGIPWNWRKGYRVMEIPVHYRQRLGEKKLKLGHGFTILRRIMAESVSSILSREVVLSNES